jgi:hypothetical protein
MRRSLYRNQYWWKRNNYNNYRIRHRPFLFFRDYEEGPEDDQGIRLSSKN